MSMHISVARKILNEGRPVSISVWKASGEIMHLENAVSLRYDYYGGFRNMKVLSSGAVRRIRDCCVFLLNGEEVRI